MYWRERNLEAIKKYREGLLRFLGYPNEGEEFIEAKVSESGFLNFYYKNRPLYFSINPYNQAEELLFKAKEDLKKGLILVFGFGGGYLVEKLLDYIDRDTIVIAVEPDSSLLKKAIEYRDLRKIIKSPNLIIGILNNKPKNISSVIAPYLDKILVSGIGILFDPSVKVYKSHFYKELKKELLDYLRTASVYYNTISTLEYAFAINTFSLAPEYILGPGIQIMKDKFKNIPAIVVSAGPSLNKNIDQIKEAKGRAVIIALGPTFKPLLAHGVQPDFVVAIDPVDLQIKMFEGAEEDTKNSILITLPLFNYKAFNLWKGKVLWMSKVDPLIRFFDQVSENFHDTIETGMTVANTAFSFANYIGANPIILMGQDLSYPTEKTHVEGAPLTRKVKLDPKSIIWVPGNYEEKVPTVRNLFSYIYLFRDMAEEIKKKDPSKVLINATEGGAKIEGFKVMRFREVLKDYIVHGKFKEIPEIPEVININRTKFFAEINNAISELYEISKISYDLIKKIKELPVEPNIKEINKLNRHIVQKQQEMMKKRYFELIKYFYEVFERKKQRREKDLEEKYKNKNSTEDFKKEVEEQKKKSITYYSQIFTVVNFYGNMLEFVRDEVKEKLKSVDK